MRTPLLCVVLLAAAEPAAAQDTLRLGALQAEAVLRDPRVAQAGLEQRVTDLRIRNLRFGRLPQFRLTADASVQSEVIDIPIALPGADIPQPPKDRYEASLRTDWLLWDGGISGARSDAERARLATALATLDARLFPVRAEVQEAFFGALLLQEQRRETALLVEDLEARLADLRAQVLAGAALAGDTAVVRAELLRARQRRSGLDAERHAALDVLAGLTGRRIGESDVLALPDLTDRLPPEDTVGTLRVHPQYDVFAARRAQLEQQAGVVRADRLPTLSAFGQLALGRPGLAQFPEDLHDYWLAGVRLQWSPWNWNARARDLAALRAERGIVDAEEAAFTERLARALERPRRMIRQLRASLATDDEIVVLREQVERQARVQLTERAIPASAYTDARTDVQEARIARVRHRVELARAEAEYLTILGMELR